MEYRIASKEDFEKLWNKHIANNPDDAHWVQWKQEFADYVATGKAVTFCIVSETGDLIGDCSILLSSECGQISGRKQLCNDKDIANINALRIDKEYEGNGYVTGLFKYMENYAREHEIKQLTIGAEAKETRNVGIYLHLGYTNFIYHEVEDGELVLYFSKGL